MCWVVVGDTIACSEEEKLWLEHFFVRLIRIWFDEWEEEQRGHMLDRMLLICTTAPPPQDELADLLGSLQVLCYTGLGAFVLISCELGNKMSTLHSSFPYPLAVAMKQVRVIK